MCKTLHIKRPETKHRDIHFKQLFVVSRIKQAVKCKDLIYAQTGRHSSERGRSTKEYLIGTWAPLPVPYLLVRTGFCAQQLKCVGGN